MNELILGAYCIITGSGALGALRFGKEGLIGFICVQVLLANLFVTKQIVLFGYTATAADALAVGITLSLNILQEYYSCKTSLKALWISFYTALFYVILSLVHLAYIPAPGDTTHTLCSALLLPLPRIIGASLVTFLSVQYLETQLYARLKSSFANRYFILRNYCSLFIAQFLDTVLFTFLGLYGSTESLSSLPTLIDIISVSTIIKATVIIITVPYVRIARTFIQDL